tara:strand:+ start:5363 stop:6154 length:792 start_codon:yes stop_codon:yes gene_type:complete
MRISKKVSFEKVKKLERFLLLKKKIEKSIENKPGSQISKIEDISKLNYYLVIDCKDVSEDFSSNNNDNNTFFSDEELNKKFIKFINKKNSQPHYFKKLGLFYDLFGCYIVATTNKDKSKVSIYNSINNISCKMDMDNLPKDLKNMCDEYESDNIANRFKKNPYLSDILDIPAEERDKLIESIVSSIAFKQIPNQNIFPEYNISENYGIQNFGGFNLEYIIESKIEDIYDIAFLNEVMSGAISDDKFEFCAKIRDRISYLKGNK